MNLRIVRIVNLKWTRVTMNVHKKMIGRNKVRKRILRMDKNSKKVRIKTFQAIITITLRSILILYSPEWARGLKHTKNMIAKDTQYQDIHLNSSHLTLIHLLTSTLMDLNMSLPLLFSLTSIHKCLCPLQISLRNQLSQNQRPKNRKRDHD